MKGLNMKYVVDQMEEDLAFCIDENQDMKAIPLRDLPRGVKENSVVVFENGKWRRDAAAEAELEARMKAKMQGLME